MVRRAFRDIHTLHINWNCVSEGEFRSTEAITFVNAEREEMETHHHSGRVEHSREETQKQLYIGTKEMQGLLLRVKHTNIWHFG